MRFSSFHPIVATLLFFPAAVLLPGNSPSAPPTQPPTYLAQTQSSDAVITNAVYLNQEGRDYFIRGQYKEALEKFQQALKLFQTAKARAGEAETLNNIGNVYHYNLEQYPQALKFYQQALVIRREVRDRVGEWATLDDIAEVSVAIGKYSQALDAYQQALAIVRQLKDKTAEKIRLTNIAGLQFRLGRFDSSLQSYQQALSIQRDTDDKSGAGTTLSNIGVVYVNLGQYAKALEFYQQALEVYKPLTAYKGAKAAILNNIGGAYFALGEYTQAVNYTQQALEIFQQFGSTDNGLSFGEVRLLYDRLSQNAPALEFRQQGIAVRREVGTAFKTTFSASPGRAATLNNLAQIYSSFGELATALKLHQQALAVARDLGDRAGEAISLNSIGQVYYKLGQVEPALKTYEQALAVYRQVGDRTGEGVTLSNIGRLYDRLGNSSQALKFYRQALQIHRDVKDQANEGVTLSNIGRLLLKSGKLKEATETLRQAAQVLESLRPGLSDTAKVSLFETQSSTYRALQQALVAQNQPEGALEIAERGRARAFVELLAGKLSATDASPDMPEIKPLGAKPNSIATSSVAEIRQIAKTHNSTLVEYSVIEDNLLSQGKTPTTQILIWVIKPNGQITLRQTTLPPSLKNSSLETLVLDSRGAIGAGNRGFTFNENAALIAQVAANIPDESGPSLELQTLHQVLIQPIADLLPSNPTDRVIFIPQGSLFLVSFPALQDAQGKYLIEQHTIITAPAIKVLDLTRQLSQRTGREQASGNLAALVVGNPTMPSLPSKAGEAPQALPSLPGAEKEAKAIASLLNIQPVTGIQATKPIVVAQMRQAKLIHLATHGLLDDFKGLGIPGAIALAPSSQDSGLLTASEIIDLKLQADLVVLSACDTGRGKITGDGVIGLSRSLISAGVPSVIVSLWKVPDASTAVLMTDFYKNLGGQAKGDRAQALRQAMLSTLQQYPDPKDWAAFTLIGEPD